MDGAWRIDLLGGLSARRGDLVITRFRTRKTAALLAYLALYPRQHSREVLIDRVWPDSELDTGRNNLRLALSSLRRQLEPPEIPHGSVITADRVLVGLNAAAFETDVNEFEAALQSAASCSGDDECEPFVAQALNLYRGPLLDGYYEEWVSSEDQRLQSLLLKALLRLITHLDGIGDRQRAVQYARAGARAIPVSEELHAWVTRLSAVRSGRHETPTAARRFHRETLREPLRQSPTARPEHPLPTAAATPARPQLPLYLTRFFGREEDIARLHELLLDPQTRLVSLRGPGGSGKTRLAVEAVQQISDGCSGAIYFVPLGDVLDSTQIFNAILKALGTAPIPTMDTLEQISLTISARAAAGGESALLILDTFERLLPDGAPQVQLLLQQVPSLKILVTSRERLGLAGERDLMLRPLPVPTTVKSDARHTDAIGPVALSHSNDDKSSLNALLGLSAVQLFLDRARAVRSDFQLTRGNAEAVAALCAHLDGMPLALELAAARASALSPGQMLSRMDYDPGVLRTHQRTVAERHRSLQATIDWSYALLNDSERRVFRRMAIFAGGCSLQACERVCSDETGGELWVLEAVTSLLDKSLLQQVEGVEGEPRFRMLDTISVYAHERLEESGEMDAIRTLHAAYYLELAEQVSTAASTPSKTVWGERLEVEQSNLRSALEWLLNQEPVAAVRLALAMDLLWHRIAPREGCDYIEVALSRAQDAPPALRGRALQAAGFLAVCIADMDRGEKFLTGSVEAFEECGDPTNLGWALMNLGSRIAYKASAREPLERSLALFRQDGDLIGTAWSLRALAAHFCEMGDVPQALSILEESLDLFRNAADGKDLGWALCAAGQTILNVEGPTSQARLLFEESLAVLERIGGDENYKVVLHRLGFIALERGDIATALSRFEELVDYLRENKLVKDMSLAWGSLSDVCLASGDYAAAQAHSQSALNLHLTAGDFYGIPWETYKLGMAALGLGNIGEARSLLMDSVRRFESFVHGAMTGPAIWQGIGDVERAAGDFNAARRYYRKCLERIRRDGIQKYYSQSPLAHCLRSLAALARLEGDCPLAAQRAAAAESIQEGLGVTLLPAPRRDWEQLLTSIRAALDDTAFQQSWDAGRQLSPAAALEWVLEML